MPSVGRELSYTTYLCKWTAFLKQFGSCTKSFKSMYIFWPTPSFSKRVCPKEIKIIQMCIHTHHMEEERIHHRKFPKGKNWKQPEGENWKQLKYPNNGRLVKLPHFCVLAYRAATERAARRRFVDLERFLLYIFNCEKYLEQFLSGKHCVY